MRDFTRDLDRRLKIYAGASLSFGVVSFLSYAYDVPLLVAPLAASACIIFAVPDSPAARPKNIILGHIFSAATGVIIYMCLGDNWLSAPIGIALSVFIMDMADVMHPPAAATCFLALADDRGFSFVLMPVAVGACSLIAASMGVKYVIGYLFGNARNS
jgi:CBS-domain-containing membrane protein